MADGSGGSDGKKKINGKVIWSGIVAVVVFVINTILNFMGVGITIIQVINFFNSWPVVLAVMCMCRAAVIMVHITEENETKRSNNNTEHLMKQGDEAEEKLRNLEKRQSELDDKIRELSKEKARLEGKVEALEEEKKKKKELDERLEKKENEILNLLREKIQLEEKNKALEAKINVFEQEKGLSKTESEYIKQSLKKGGTGGLNITLFSGKNGTNAEDK